jgi:hypothetical protein
LVAKHARPGDLNNLTSDARTAEGSRLLAQDDAQGVAADREIDRLSHEIAQAMDNYREIPHDAEEEALYRRFTTAWYSYEDIAIKVLALRAIIAMPRPSPSICMPR